MSATETAWVAGLLEGEGSFMALGRAHRPDKRPRLSCIMSDRDVIERLVVTVGGNARFSTHPNSGLGKKPLWSWTLTRAAECRELCQTLRPHMGSRRQDQIDLMLAAFADIKIAPVGHCTEGHPIAGENAGGGGGQRPICRTCNRAKRQARRIAAGIPQRPSRRKPTCLPQSEV